MTKMTQYAASLRAGVTIDTCDFYQLLSIKQGMNDLQSQYSPAVGISARLTFFEYFVMCLRKSIMTGPALATAGIVRHSQKYSSTVAHIHMQWDNSRECITIAECGPYHPIAHWEWHAKNSNRDRQPRQLVVMTWALVNIFIPPADK